MGLNDEILESTRETFDLELAKSSDILKLPDEIYGTIKQIGTLNDESILSGDVNLLKPNDLYYIPAAKQIYRYIKSKKVSPRLSGRRAIDEEVIGGPSEDSPAAISTTITYCFNTIQQSDTEGLLVPEEEKGKIRKAGTLFNKPIYSGDPNLVDNGNMFYHETLPYVSTVSIEDDTITLSTSSISSEGEVETNTTEYSTKYEPIDYSKQYLTITMLGPGTLTLKYGRSYGMDDGIATSLSYSIDNGKTWETVIPIDRVIAEISVQLNEGDIALIKGINKTLSYTPSKEINYARVTVIGRDSLFNVSGNIMSLLYGDDFALYDTFEDLSEFNYNSYSIFQNLFADQNVYSAKDLILPSTTIENCYLGMFDNCSNLVDAPKLPALQLSANCYREMFKGCLALTTAPELPATTLTYCCYYRMFRGCTSLVTAPDLLAIELTDGCYSFIFHGCNNLNYVKALFVQIGKYDIDPLDDWLYGVSRTGTFVKNANTTWDNREVGIPDQWTVETVDVESDEITI